MERDDILALIQNNPEAIVTIIQRAFEGEPFIPTAAYRYT